MKTYRMDVAYDGTRYSGWQRLGDDPETIQGKLETALSRLLEETLEIDGSGRTDAGVHARRQTVSFSTERAFAPDRLQAQLNHYLPSDITVLSLEEAEGRFHARYLATGKCYRYRLWNAPLVNPLERRYRHHVPEPLDLEKMRRAADVLMGTYDFSAFTAMKSKKKSAVRTLREISLKADGAALELTFVGDGFLHHMVRIIVGTLLEVGAGRMTVKAVADALAAQNRAQAGPLAPANGLVLWGVDYGDGFDEEPEGWRGLSR